MLLLLLLMLSPLHRIFTLTYLKKTMSLLNTCCSYSVVTVSGIRNAITSVKSIVLLHQYFPIVCVSAQYVCLP